MEYYSTTKNPQTTGTYGTGVNIPSFNLSEMSQILRATYYVIAFTWHSGLKAAKSYQINGDRD